MTNHNHAPNSLMLFTGNANEPLAAAIAAELKTTLCDRTLGRFNDDEIQCEVMENVRDCDVYIVQSTSRPVNENLMELLVLTDALKRASAKRVTAVIPYYGYARQDRKDKQRVPISARLVADLLEAAGVDRVLTVHLHSAQIQGFFDIPLDHLYTSELLLSALPTDREYTVVSADAGGVKRSRVFAHLMDNAPLAIIDKRRDGPGQNAVMNIIGEVKDKHCLIAEDMIDTGGTLIKAINALTEAGAASVSVCCTHAVLSNGAAERLSATAMERIIVTDSIHHEANNLTEKFTTVSLAPLLAEAVKNIHEGKSITALYN